MGVVSEKVGVYETWFVVTTEKSLDSINSTCYGESVVATPYYLGLFRQ